MKKMTTCIWLAACAIGLLAISDKLVAADAPQPPMSCCGGMAAAPTADTATNAVPDLLATCPVSGDKLGADMGKPYVFVYQGQEVKLCCHGCKKDFDKNTATYVAKIRAADKK